MCVKAPAAGGSSLNERVALMFRSTAVAMHSSITAQPVALNLIRETADTETFSQM